MHKIDSFQLAKDTAASEQRMLTSPQDWNAKKGMSQLLSHHQACKDNFVKNTNYCSVLIKRFRIIEFSCRGYRWYCVYLANNKH